MFEKDLKHPEEMFELIQNIPKQPKNFNKKENRDLIIKEILEKREQGKTVSEIAKEMGVCKNTLYNRYPEIVKTQSPLNSKIVVSSMVSKTSTSPNDSIVSVQPSNVSNDLVLTNFRVQRIMDYEDTIDFSHPFTCKCLGSRGSGKTTFIILYLNTACLSNYDRIIWFTTTAHQDLMNSLEPNAKESVEFLEPSQVNKLYDEIVSNSSELVSNPSEKILMIFDDCMQEKTIRNSKSVMGFYTKGRHLGVSLISLEQHMNYSSNVERGNTDYFLLFKINDVLALDTFRTKFCSEYRQDDFMQMYRYCVDGFQPFIISFKGRHKYRCEFNKTISIQCGNLLIKEIIVQEKVLDVVVEPHKRKCSFLECCMVVLDCFCG